MKETLKISAVFPVTAKRLFDAWLDSDEHGEFTGGKAIIEGRSGGKFSISDGYITGTTVLAQPYGRIVQSWRTAEFPKGASDSNLEILFEKTSKGTRITLIHTNIPDGQGDKYKKGWKKHYFEPMKKYFARK